MKWKNPFRARPEAAQDTDCQAEKLAASAEETAVKENAETAAPDALPELRAEQLSFLKEQYPELNEKALLESGLFQKFAARCGNEAEQIRLGFDDFVEELLDAQAALEPPVNRATGSAARARSVPLSAAQRKELAEWNRTYPEYRMSEREFYRSVHDA